jgi:Putative FMN-binding domain
MYVPKHFEESRSEVLHELIRRHPLGMLVASSPEGIEACHVPFLLDPHAAAHGTLRCHVARANPIWNRALLIGTCSASTCAARTPASRHWSRIAGAHEHEPSISFGMSLETAPGDRQLQRESRAPTPDGRDAKSARSRT